MPHDPTTRPPLRWWSTRLWGVHALAILAVAVTVALGWWQWTVSEGHKADKSDAIAHLAPVPLSSVMGHNDAFPGAKTGRPAVLTGVWLPSGTVYVSGHQGGYWVATPLAIGSSADAPAMYVVRGWVASPQDAPAAPTGPAKVVGWLQPPEDAGLTDTDTSDDILPELAISDAMNHVKQDLYSGYAVLADGTQPGQTTRTKVSWPAADAQVNDGGAGLRAAQVNAAPEASFTTGLRNLLYALEWWVFALFAIYVWWRYVREVTSPKDDEDEGSAEGLGHGDVEAGTAENRPQEDAVTSGP